MAEQKVVVRGSFSGILKIDIPKTTVRNALNKSTRNHIKYDAAWDEIFETVYDKIGPELSLNLSDVEIEIIKE